MNRPRCKQVLAKKERSWQQEFVQHCSIIIQSRFRGYIQRKRYRAFLPIYRRFRELLFAIYNGWKTRKILKLNPIKKHINQIKARMKNGQTSQIRISKRQLSDDIQRMSKRGRWIEILFKEKNANKTSYLQRSKENCPLYGNIKSKSIKNIFSTNDNKKNFQDPSKTKIMINNKNKFGTKGKIQTQIKESFIKNSVETNISEVVNFDQIPIKGTSNAYHFEDELIRNKYGKNIKNLQQRKSIQKIEQNVPISKQRHPKSIKKGNQNKKLEKSKIQIKKIKQNDLPQINSTQEEVIPKKQISQTQQLDQHKKCKKIKLTLSIHTNSKYDSEQQKNSQISCKRVIESNNKMQLSCKSELNFPKRHESASDLALVYDQTYCKKKELLKNKLSIMNTDYAHQMKDVYKQIAKIMICRPILS